MRSDDVYLLHHEWYLRGDDKRVLLFRADVEGAIKSTLVVDPIVAVVLSLFDGSRTIMEIGNHLSELFDQTPEASVALV